MDVRMKLLRKWIVIMSLALFAITLYAPRATALVAAVEPGEYDEQGDPLYLRSKAGSMRLMGGSSYTIAEAKKKLTHQSGFADTYILRYGVDVSKWQGTIDWKKAKAAGVEFAIIRLGNRTVTAGEVNLDPYFVRNIEGAYEQGIEVGVYFYTQAINEKEAVEEAEFCIENLEPYKKYLSYPVFYDIEPYNGGTGRLDKAKLSKKQKTALCSAFCETVDLAGYQAGIYASKYYLTAWMNIDELENKYDIWNAHYADSTDYSRRYDMWQYSSVGLVDGIPGTVDMDVSYILAKPPVPGDFEQTAIASDSLSLGWSAVPHAAGYQVCQYNEDDEAVKKYTVKDTKLVLENLISGENYRFKVRCYYLDSNGTKKYSSYSTMLVAYTTPDKVEKVTLAERGSDYLRLSWEANEIADGYRIRSYDLETGKYSTVKTVKTNTYTIADLSEKSHYVYAVQAFVKMNGTTKKYGDYSEQINCWTAAKKVSGLTFSKLNTKSFKVSWDGQSKIEGYQLVWLDANGKELGQRQITKNSMEVSSLSSGKLYQVKVRAYYKNASGNAIYGQYTAPIKVTTLPAAVTKLKQTAAETDRITLSWSKKQGAAGYSVYQYDSASKTYKRIKLTTETTYTVRKLASATKYKFKVRAFVLNNSRKYYGAYSAVYTAVTRPDAVKSLKVSAQTKSSVTVSWKKVSRAEGYQIRLYKNKKLVATYTTKKTTYKLKKLSGKYTVKVRAYRSAAKVVYSPAYAKVSASTKSK